MTDLVRHLKLVVNVDTDRRIDDLSFEIGASVTDIVNEAHNLFGSFILVDDGDCEDCIGMRNSGCYCSAMGRPTPSARLRRIFE